MAKSGRTQIVLSADDRKRLEKISSDPHSILRHVQREAIILHLGGDFTLSQTMRATGMSKPTVRRWWDRFLAEGVDGLLRGIPRRPGLRPISGDMASELIDPAMSPPEHAGHRTLRALAKELGIAVPTVFGILNRNGLKPHRVKTFRVFRDLRFELEIRDVVGPYVNPPDQAVVISVDGSERADASGSRERANADPGAGAEPDVPADDAQPSRDRCPRLQAQRRRLPDGGPRRRHRKGHRPDGRASPLGGVPPLPRPRGRGDRARNPGPCHPRQRLLPQVGRSRRMAEEQRQMEFRCTPAPASRLNAVGGFFSRHSRQRLRHAVSRSRDDCLAAIKGYIEHQNANYARPFRCSRKPEELVEAWKKGHRKLQESAS